MVDRPPSVPPRLLVLHDDSAFSERVSGLLRPHCPRLTVETCASPHDLHQALLGSPCHAIIASPSRAVAKRVSALTFSQRVQPSVPLLMTLSRNERDLANDWLHLGAYDFIYDPIDHKEALHSLQQALLLSKWRILVAQKEQTLAYLRKRREQYQVKQPQSPLRIEVDRILDASIQHIETSIRSLSKTIHLVETTLTRLRQSCTKNVDEARLRATKGR